MILIFMNSGGWGWAEFPFHSRLIDQESYVSDWGWLYQSDCSYTQVTTIHRNWFIVPI